MKEEIHFAPEAHLVQSLINTNLQWNEGIPELIDNSIDKRARNIDIEFKAESVSISDDGAGCPDLKLMLAYGASNDESGQAVGRYGVGLKNTAAALARKIFIRSICAGFSREIELEWELVESEGWRGDQDVNRTKEPSGVAIELRGLRKRLPQRDAIALDLEQIFWPAIRAGIVITVNGERLSELHWPDFEETFLISGTLDPGTSFVASGGILKPGQSNKGMGPFVISYRHRVIDLKCSEPCGDFLTSDRFLCHVQLFEDRKGRWALYKHKDGLKDSSMREQLYDALATGFEPILKRLSEEGEALEIEELQAELSGMVTQAVKGQESRGSGETSNASEPQKTGRERLTANRINGQGKCDSRDGTRTKGGFYVTFNELNGAIGRVDVNGKRVQVKLNKNHPTIDRWRKTKQKEALFTAAIALLDGHQVMVGKDNPEQLKFPIVDASFGTFVHLFGQCVERVLGKPIDSGLPVDS